jgi:hypothetical protein
LTYVVPNISARLRSIPRLLIRKLAFAVTNEPHEYLHQLARWVEGDVYVITPLIAEGLAHLNAAAACQAFRRGAPSMTVPKKVKDK